MKLQVVQFRPSYSSLWRTGRNSASPAEVWGSIPGMVEIFKLVFGNAIRRDGGTELLLLVCVKKSLCNAYFVMAHVLVLVQANRQSNVNYISRSSSCNFR